MTESRKAIVLTGGGSAGHVTPNLALVPALRRAGFDVHYIGSVSGIERELVAEQGIPYDAVPSGKLRRYASLQNWTDPARVLLGVAKAFQILGRIKPAAVFSKGGFVAVPVVFAAALRRIPVVVHESDRTPGLANRLSFPFAARICVSFEESKALVGTAFRGGAERIVYTGSPIRPELLAGDPKRAESHFELAKDLPVVLIVGGSLGARAINEAVFALARDMPPDLQIVHVCGKGNVDPALAGVARYHAVEYLSREFPDILARADAVVTRAGANALAEMLALRKPALLIPLPAGASRGDQLENARVYVERGYGVLLEQDALEPARLRAEIKRLLDERAAIVERMQCAAPIDGATAIVRVLEDVARGAA